MAAPILIEVAMELLDKIILELVAREEVELFMTSQFVNSGKVGMLFISATTDFLYPSVVFLLLHIPQEDLQKMLVLQLILFPWWYPSKDSHSPLFCR